MPFYLKKAQIPSRARKYDCMVGCIEEPGYPTGEPWIVVKAGSRKDKRGGGLFKPL